MTAAAGPAPVLHAVTPYGRRGASSRVRVLTWAEYTAAPVTVHSYLGHRNASLSYVARHPAAVVHAERDLRRTARRRPDRLLLHREASPVSRGGIEAALLRSATLSVYDFDDALQWDHGHGAPLRRVFPKSRKAHAGARLADRVIAGNPTLADWASAYNDEVIVIPSCVEPAAYQVKADYRLADPPRLAWVGSVSEEKQLRLVAAALLEVHRRTGARLLVIGEPGGRLGPLETMIDRVAWSEQAQSERLAAADVGLMPMVDEPYERGKCGYKLLQYGAVGLPALASPVGVNVDLQAQMGMPAPATTSEWVDGLLQLLDAPPDRRAAAGAHARDVVNRSYSYDVWLARWEAAVGIDGAAQ